MYLAHTEAPGGPPVSDSLLAEQLQRVARAIGMLACALGAAVLLGWAMGITALRAIAPGLPAMMPNTAVGLALAGLALWLVAARRAPALAAGLALAVAAIGAVTLAEYLGWAAPAPDTLLTPAGLGGAFPGRPSPTSALNLALIGVALLMLAPAAAPLAGVGQVLAALVALNGLRALLGYVVGASGLYALTPTTGVSIHGAVAFIALGAGACLARPTDGAMRLVTARGPGSLALRVLLPFGVALPLTLSSATYHPAVTGLLGASLPLVVFTMLNLVVFWALAAALNRSAARQAHAAAEARRQARRAEALLAISRRLNDQLDLPAVLAAVAEMTAAALDMPLVLVMLVGARGQRLVLAHDRGLSDEARRLLRPLPLADHRALVERRGSPALVPDLREGAGVPGGGALALMGARTVALAELRHGGELIGTLTLASVGAPRQLTPDDLELLCGLADHAAQAITNARLHATTQAQSVAHARLHAATERRLRHMRALHAIDNAILTGRQRDQALAVVLERSCAELETDIALAWLIEPRTGLLVRGPTRGLRVLAPTAVALPGTLAAESATRQEVLWRAGTDSDATYLLRAPHLAGEGAVFTAAAPLIANGALLGVLEVAHRAPREPDSEWLEFLRTLAGQAAIAVDYLRVLDDLALANDRLVEAYDSTLAGWARALDLRDHDTAGHCERVTSITVELARLFGIPEEDLTQVRRGALLHDIGKLGVPDAILLKPGRLTSDERAVIELHPVYAHEWLSPIAFLKDALDIPFAHHERWDGAGYPRGLRGEEIPLAARLFAVVDVWDALTSDRPYRAALPPDEALAYLESQAGTHFDPQVVAAFRELVERDRLRERAIGQ